MNFTPVASYRIQLHKEFSLHDAAGLVPYLAGLGVDFLYTSPSLQAAAGSTSGYDVTDPLRSNDELGGEDGHDALTAALRHHGMYRLADIVPNHMAVMDGSNPWWNDVLAYGRWSQYARWFDIDWDSARLNHQNQILLPVLHDHFGRVLEAGEFRIERTGSTFSVHYRDMSFPVEPSSAARILKPVAQRLDHPQLGFVADKLLELSEPGMMSAADTAHRQRDHAVLRDLLERCCREHSDVARMIDAEVRDINNSFVELARLLDAQNYRLAHWAMAERDMDYRRFFDVNALAGLRIELTEVFAAVHDLPLRWYREGAIQGLRIDHPDGLRDPLQYLQRLRQQTPDAWLVVEKILGAHESLPGDWPVEGTTGYDFANRVQGLFVDPAGEQELTACYQDFTNDTASFKDVAPKAKKCVLSTLLGSDVSRLTSLLQDICHSHWRHRDHTRAALSEAIIAVTAHFPVYRTYMRPGQPASPCDKTYVAIAIERTRHTSPDIDEELLDFIQQLLLMEIEGTVEEEFAQRFQQLSDPATAKGVEDTAFYRYRRLVALNEVGGDPGRWGCSVEEFHNASARAAPFSMLATSTHDTKRSEDVRARLLVLTEIAPQWRQVCQQWRELNDRNRGTWWDYGIEYLYYQTLVGAWPVSEQRMIAYMKKAERESKEHTSWTQVNDDFERGLRTFIERSMRDPEFMSGVQALVHRILFAGRINSLAQTLIKLTAPGVPDIYQGCELWDLSLVDPDNRRPVDYIRRRALLAELSGLTTAAIMGRLDEGLPKLWLIHSLLQLRRKRPDCFGADAGYTALYAEGMRAAHVIGYCRGKDVIAIAPRLVMAVLQETALDWQDTEIALPSGQWSNVLDPVEMFSGRVGMENMLRTFPMAVLLRSQ